MTIFGDMGRFGGESIGRKLTEVSLASSINLGVPLTIVTHASFTGLTHLKGIKRKFDHVQLAVYSDDALQYNPGWVHMVESFKIVHLRENMFKNLIYIELDMPPS